MTSPPHRIPLMLALWGLLFGLGGRRGRVAALTLILVAAASDQVSSGLLKPWVDRLRPCFALPETRLLLPRQPQSPSFPSGHATNSFAVAVLLFDVHPLLGWLGLVVAGLISYSRVYVGVHYPLDVLCGALLGTAIAWCGLRLRTILGRILHRPWTLSSFRGMR